MRTTDRASSSPNSSNAATWLVKSGDRIVGPFTTKEVLEKIRTKEIVVIDEISAPLSRWRYVRDQPEFESVVEEIRKGLMSAREDTEVQGYTNTATTTETDTQTNPTVTEIDNEGSLTRLDSERISRPNLATPDIVDADFTEETLAMEPRRLPERPKTVRQFGVQGPASSSVSRGHSSIGSSDVKVRPSHRGALITAVVVLLVSVVFLVIQAKRMSSGSTPSQSVDVGRVSKEAALAWDLGEFDRALLAYRQANAMSPGRPEIVTRLAVLTMRVDGQTVEAKRLLQDLAATNDKIASEDLRAIDIALGLVALESEDLVEAESRFARAAEGSSGDWIATYNRGVAAYTGKQWSKAIDHFRSVRSSPSAKMMLLRSLLSSTETTKSPSHREAEEIVETFSRNNGEFQQEALLIAAYMDAEAGNKKRATLRARAILDADPDLMEEMSRDPRVSDHLLAWPALSQMCNSLNEELRSIVSRAVLAFCLEKSGRRDEAFKAIEADLNRAPADAVLQSVNAYLLSKNERDEDARAALRIASKNDPKSELAPKIVHYIGARTCARIKDVNCEEAAWMKLAADPQPSMAALTGLATIRYARGDRSGAELIASRIDAKGGSRYLPLLRLKSKMQESIRQLPQGASK